MQVAQGQLDNALKSFQAYLAIAERLARLDPSNAQWQRDVDISRRRVAEVTRQMAAD